MKYVLLVLSVVVFLIIIAIILYDKKRMRKQAIKLCAEDGKIDHQTAEKMLDADDDLLMFYMQEANKRRR